MPSWLALGFQDRCSFSMGELNYLHDYVMIVILCIIVLITYVMVYLLLSSKLYKNLSEGTFIEVIWSLVPAFILILLVIPSMKVLFIMEDVKSPLYTFKVVAHQWYWSYVVPLRNNFGFFLGGNYYNFFEFDSILEEWSYGVQFPRLMGCSSDFFVPVSVTSRLLITSTDVIHSFAVPSLGLKVDAVPGRINQLFSSPLRLGRFWGQCSEICGSNHSFIPISLKVCSIGDFNKVGDTYLVEIFGGLEV